MPLCLRAAIETTTIAAGTAAAYLAWKAVMAYLRSREKRRLLHKLPTSLDMWRAPPDVQDGFLVWQSLMGTFKHAGLLPWQFTQIGAQRTPDRSDVSPNGYIYTNAVRGTTGQPGPGSVYHLRTFWIYNMSSHLVRTKDGIDAVVRVVAIGDEGREQLRIWRKLATAPHALISTNHTLPLIQEFDLEHITFAVFPYVAQPMATIYGSWAKNSVGDILDAVMQALEGLAYIHSLGVAHRDAFKYNFVMQWYPESLLTGAAPVSHPRVFLIDFEAAIEFPADSPSSERVCTGLPCINSISNADEYKPPRIPEMDTGALYDPFKLDVWQLGTSLLDFDSTIPPVEEVLVLMASDEPTERLTAEDALARLRRCVEDIPPKALLIPPVVQTGPGFEFPSSDDLRAACEPVVTTVATPLKLE